MAVPPAHHRRQGSHGEYLRSPGAPQHRRGKTSTGMIMGATQNVAAVKVPSVVISKQNSKKNTQGRPSYPKTLSHYDSAMLSLLAKSDNSSATVKAGHRRSETFADFGGKKKVWVPVVKDNTNHQQQSVSQQEPPLLLTPFKAS